MAASVGCLYSSSSRPDPFDAVRDSVLELSSATVTYAIWLPSGDQTGDVFAAASRVMDVPFPVRRRRPTRRCSASPDRF